MNYITCGGEQRTLHHGGDGVLLLPAGGLRQGGRLEEGVAALLTLLSGISPELDKFLLLLIGLLAVELDLQSLFWLHVLCCSKGVTKRCLLSWLTNSAVAYETKCGGGELRGSQPRSTAIHRSPNKLWRFNTIFNLWLHSLYSLAETSQPPPPLPPHLGSYIRGRYWSAKIDDIAFVTPCCYWKCMAFNPPSPPPPGS